MLFTSSKSMNRWASLLQTQNLKPQTLNCNQNSSFGGGPGQKGPSAPHALHPTLETLHPTPYTLHPSPYTPSPYTLHPTLYRWCCGGPEQSERSAYCSPPTSSTPHPAIYTPHPTPYTINHTSYQLHPTCYIPHFQKLSLPLHFHRWCCGGLRQSAPSSYCSPPTCRSSSTMTPKVHGFKN